MALNKDFYRALEDVVGKNNVSDDPAVTENYRSISAQTSAHYGPEESRTPRPLAVVLPGSTEEVQQVIKLCNKYMVDFKAASTFWATMGYIGSDNAIQIDMIRMDNVTVDAKNMLAVIEPFAIGGTVQVEAMKNGLNCSMAGVGCSSSILAGTVGWNGLGPSSTFMGNAGENMLGAEYVLPNGDILRTGTLGSEGEWFCGEGPGPSTRAIIRGRTGTAGAMGICTKLAIRLHPWPGPKWIPVRGTAPLYQTDKLDCIRAYTICFPDWNAFAKASQLFYEADILYLGHRQFNLFGRDIKTTMVEIFTHPEKQFRDIPEVMADPYIKEQNEQMAIDIQVILAGFTERDMDYKEKALDSIIEQTKAHRSEYYLQQDIEDFVKLYLIRLARKNYNFTLCSSYEGHFGLSPNVWVASPLVEEAADIKREWETEKTSIAAVGGDTAMGSISGMGGGGTSTWEFFVHFDAFEPDSIRGTKEHIDQSSQWMASKGLGTDMGRGNVDLRKSDGYDYSQEEHDAIYSKLPQPAIATYQWKIREAFNSNKLTGSYYRTLTPQEYKGGE